MKAGGAYVPLDPGYPQERLEYMAADAQVEVLLTQERLLAGLPKAGAKHVYLDAHWGVIEQESAENPANQATAENLAYVIYTSGSTGQPKGSLVPHGGLCNLVKALSESFEIRAKGRVLQFASISFDASVSEIFTALTTGATLCMGSREALMPGMGLIEFLREKAIEVAKMPPSVLAVLPQEELPALKTLVSAGEACTVEIVNRWGSGRRFVNVYGPTEVTVCCSLAVCRAMASGLTIGKPIWNTQIYLLDQHWNPVPIGVIGELYVGGVGVARGYLNRADLTAKRFIPDAFSGKWGSRLYKTGDLGCYLPDGNIEFYGRRDQQVKIRGYRIELGEIESVIRGYGGVENAVVVVREDEPGEKRLVGYVVWREGKEVANSQLRSYLQGKLPEYMVPGLLMVLDQLPLTPNGKVDRKALSNVVNARSKKTFAEPRNAIEAKLAEIWANLLRLDKVGIEDNFFELGGHSLLIPRFLSEVEKIYGLKLKMRSLFEAPTISSFSKLISQPMTNHSASRKTALVRLQSGGRKRPIILVHPIGGGISCYLPLVKYLGTSQPIYALQAAELEEVPEQGMEYQSIEEMAQAYLREVLEFDPVGPYLLGGYSYGGVIAFEMARQLIQVSKKVSLLALLDASSPDRTKKLLPPFIHGSQDEGVRYLRLARGYAQQVGKSLNISFKDLENLEADQKIRYVLDRLIEGDIVPVNTKTEILYRILHGYRQRVKLMESYEPQVLHQTITLFKAKEMSKDLGQNTDASVLLHPTLGWSDISSKPVKVYEVPGSHETLLIEPHVKDVAKALKQVIRKCEIGVVKSKKTLAFPL
jgi:amino acid adenylation domain-containing protein